MWTKSVMSVVVVSDSRSFDYTFSLWHAIRKVCVQIKYCIHGAGLMLSASTFFSTEIRFVFHFYVILTRGIRCCCSSDLLRSHHERKPVTRSQRVEVQQEEPRGVRYGGWAHFCVELDERCVNIFFYRSFTFVMLKMHKFVRREKKSCELSAFLYKWIKCDFELNHKSSHQCISRDGFMFRFHLTDPGRIVIRLWSNHSNCILRWSEIHSYMTTLPL